MNISDYRFEGHTRSPFKESLVTSKVELVESAPVEYSSASLGWQVQESYRLDAETAERLGPWLHFEPNIESRGVREVSPALHRIFASLETTPQDVLGFAKRYGQLGVIRYYAAEPSHDADSVYESVLGWYEEIHILRILVTALDLYRSDAKEGKQIDGLIRTAFEEMGQVPFPAKFRRLQVLRMEWNAGKETTKETLETLLRAEVTGGLTSWCYPSISFNTAQPYSFNAMSAIGAIYAALAQECTGFAGLPRQCAGCGEWFMAQHGRSRHCSESCKTKAYRRRQQHKEKTHG